ncbi:MAG: sensor histidine kinase [Aggregatilineales bacterium]
MEQFQLTSGTAHTLQFTNESHSQNACLDEHLLRHILVNLLSNAIKYSPKGGEVRFAVREDVGLITFEVTDQGIGIPTADQARLFEPFHRAKNTTNIQGTGLALKNSPLTNQNFCAIMSVIVSPIQARKNTLRAAALNPSTGLSSHHKS